MRGHSGGLLASERSALDGFAKLVSQFRESFPEARDKKISIRIGLNLKAEKSEYLSPPGLRRVLLSGNPAENKRII